MNNVRIHKFKFFSRIHLDFLVAAISLPLDERDMTNVDCCISLMLKITLWSFFTLVLLWLKPAGSVCVPAAKFELLGK